MPMDVQMQVGMTLLHMCKVFPTGKKGADDHDII